jgi:hypothetical protein
MAATNFLLAPRMPQRGPAAASSMDMSREAFCAQIYRENAGRFSRDQHFVRACAVEMHMDMSQEGCWKFAGKMPDAPDSTSIEHRALTPTLRSPQCGQTVWGKIECSICKRQLCDDILTFKSGHLIACSICI